MKKLDKETIAKIDQAAVALRDAAQEGQDYLDEKSETWRKGDKGTSYGAWLEEIENLADELDGLAREPD